MIPLLRKQANSHYVVQFFESVVLYRGKLTIAIDIITQWGIIIYRLQPWEPINAYSHF